MAVVLMVISAMLGGTVQVAAFAAPTASASTIVPAAVTDDDEDAFNRQLVEDIAKGAADIEVREAAQAALDTNDPAKILEFLDYGEPAAKKRAADRKKLVILENREKVKLWAETGGPNVRAGAKAAWDSGDDVRIGDFVAYGKEIAEKQDAQAAVDTKAEQERIIGRVRDMVAHGGPQVKVEGEAILAIGDYEQIAEFYKTGYAEANKRDHDYQAQIEKALDDRNKAVAALTDLAKRSADAATARAEIIRANMEALKFLEDGVRFMQLGTAAARNADRIFQEDKPLRANGQRGRNPEIDAFRAEAAQNARQAAETAELTGSTSAQAQNAATKLEQAGMTNGLDWAKVTIAVGAATKAAAKATETAQHAAEATLADSRALDADANAQEHADNARKWREEAERQAQAAADLAAAAKVQEQIAVKAAERAKAQQLAAEDAARKARAHAANARTARVNAQAAASNAIDRSNKAVLAHNVAVKAKVAEDAAFKRTQQASSDLWFAVHSCGIKQSYADQVEQGLKRARDEAIAAGKDADEATKVMGEMATRARADANASAGYADRARAFANRAKAEADAARAEAQRAKQAAAQADQEAVTARRAADEANRLTIEAVVAVNAAKSAAENTQSEAYAAVDEAAQATYQSAVAGRAAYAARASSAQIIDPAHTAIDLGTPSSEVNADARFALEAAADALAIGAEQAAAAQAKAREADEAAQRARGAAEAAIDEVKPAFEAVERAAESAAAAAQSAEAANNAANAAAQSAQNAHRASNDASQASSMARSEAVQASNAAAIASSAAEVAGKAAGETEALYAWAVETTGNIHQFATNVQASLTQFYDLKKQAEEEARLKREEAERHQRELEANFLLGATNVIKCLKYSNPAACGEVKSKIDELAGKAKDAISDYYVVLLSCTYGNDEQACVKLREANAKIEYFVTQAIDGFKEGAVNFGKGLLELGHCGLAGPAVPSGYAACGRIADSFKQILDHPLELFHLSEWDRNPGKALGLSLFDLTTFAIPNPAGALIKALDAVGSAVGRAVAKFLNNVIKIDHFAVPLANFANKVAEVLGLTLKIENGLPKVTNGIVKIDGVPYRLEIGAIKAEGDLAKLEGMAGRIEGGTIRLEGDVAKFEGGTLKVEPVHPGLEPTSPIKPDPFGPGCNSFAASTQVLMADGRTKQISQIAVGDEVANSVPDSGVVEKRKVLAVNVTDSDREFVDLAVGASTITTTAHHWFWNPAKHGWVDAGDLRAGDRVATPGADAEVRATRAYSSTMRTYNLSVDAVHTFYVVAGNTPALVHNCGNLTADAAKFRDAHILDEHVNVTPQQAIDLAKAKSTSGTNGVFLDQQIAQQVVDYALASNATKISNWLRKTGSEASPRNLELTGAFGADNPLGWVAKADGAIVNSTNRYFIVLKRDKSHKPGGYFVLTGYPL
ncbi:RNase A-like domain-containing protein [Amycolatopsis xylanica]|uniref:RNase A-like domain-containing protein n=1 Tax=Amycolatopsis xylanica TaxID=589385 RepID=UPI001C40A39D|nr:RNase A-like domain-containing protein [Amycolatopsis xylanica]